MSRTSIVYRADLSENDTALLDKVTVDLPITADLCRADLLLYTLAREGEVVIEAQARPHSSATLYEDDRVGVREPEEVIDGFRDLRFKAYRLKSLDVRGANVARQMFPVYNSDGDLIAMLARDAYWLAHERHRRRAKAFQNAVIEFIWTVLHGRLVGSENLTPFREHDGIMYVDADGYIRYMSGICAEMYRGLGYRDSLIDRAVSEINTIDYQMVQEAIAKRGAFERAVEQNGQLHVRKALPIISQDRSLWGRLRTVVVSDADLPWKHRGVLILIHDATETVRVQRALESQIAIVREVHHRVKNNLQVIASIMRMEARRAKMEETRQALEDSVQRVLSVAVVHDFLSQQAEGTTINLREVANRITTQVQQSLVPPDKHIKVILSGPDIWLPAERAIQCALIVNELVQNAIEHGMENREQGQIQVILEDNGSSVEMIVADDGKGLGDNFDLDTQANLGLRIVQSMIERDLRGTFQLDSDTSGTRATISFEK